VNTLPQDVIESPRDDGTQVSPEISRLAGLCPRPKSLAQTGLSLTFLAELLGKQLAHAGVLTTSQIIERMALAGPIVDQVLQFMRAEGRVEVRSRLGLDPELRYGLTDRGRSEAVEALQLLSGRAHRVLTAICLITPAALGPQYFREAAEVINAAAGGPPDRAKMAEIMRRHGLTPAPPPR